MLFPCDFPQHAHSVVYVRIRVPKQTQILAFFYFHQTKTIAKSMILNKRNTRRQRNFTGHLRRVRIVYINCKRNKTKFFHW